MPVTVKSPTSHFICPSIKIQVIAPNVESKEIALSITAFIGKIIDPVNTKISINTLSATQPSAQGNVRAIPSCESVKSAAAPPIRTPAGLSSALMECISPSAAVVRELTDGIA